MRLRFGTAALAILFLLSGQAIALAQDAPARTALDDYIQKPDDAYKWKIVSETEENGLKLVVINLTSQSWRSPDEVNRTKWKHSLKVAIPKTLRDNTAFLMVGSGSNRDNRNPDPPSTMIQQLAMSTGTVAAELGMVPNQPLVFHDDGRKRSEDNLIGYSWDQFLKTGDPTWAAQLPMVKSAIRAMDTIVALMASETGGKQTIDAFVVAGASKRGWTTWLAGLDDRVVAIIPIVIDVLNTKKSMQHHFASYGFWAPAVANYVQHRIMQRMHDPKGEDLYDLVDPYSYRHRLTKPKYIVNATGDQFFLLDSSQFYYQDLEGEKHLRYVPNAGHSLRNSDAIEGIATYYSTVLTGTARPQLDWAIDEDGTITVTTDQTPSEVLFWQATNPDARDFRIDRIGPAFTSTSLKPMDDGRYVGKLASPEKGWTAGFIELSYDVNGPDPLKLTTEVSIVPRTLPHQDKPADLPTYVTIRCDAPDEAAADQMIAMARVLADSRPGITELSIYRNGQDCIFHWKPELEELKDAIGLLGILQQQGCKNVRLQLESGPEITGFPEGMMKTEPQGA